MKKNNTMVPGKCKNGVIELYPKETVIAVAVQKLLGVDKINNPKNTVTLDE